MKNIIENKRIAYVCPSPHLKGKGLGKLIDSYDLVVRINQSYEMPKSDWADYGSKTDIVINCFNEHKRTAISENTTFTNSLKHIINTTKKDDFLVFLSKHKLFIQIAISYIRKSLLEK